MGLKYSVVIPSFNRGPQLLLTLSAFEKQRFPKSDFEVIVVDDGSTDDTQKIINSIKPSYRLVYVKLPNTQGRSVARNKGVKAARGRYIIFCDADFLVLPNFISTHHRYLHRYRHSVVSGYPNCWKNVYTLYYPKFSAVEKKRMRHVLKQKGLWSDKFRHATRIMNVITREDILHNLNKVKRAASTLDMDRSSKKEYANTDVAPWLLFVTRCVSVKKKYILEVGGFNEKFKAYGLEDWELGYRLHRRGLKFVSIKERVGFHQEHPASFRGHDANSNNLKILLRKHGLESSALNLFTVVPPWKNIKVYKDTLRKIRLYSMGTRYQKRVARSMRRKFRLAAKRFLMS